MAFSTGGDRNDVVSEINITPLVDVMLVLLVTFIITAPLLNNAVHINLPKTAATAPPSEVKAVTVSVDANSKIFIDKQEVASESLEPELKKLVASNKDVALNFQADEGVQYRTVAKTIATIQRAGVGKLSVLTEPIGG
ncbi:MAG: biopolymer transporter ExbD [Pseudomonadota bacterium]